MPSAATDSDQIFAAFPEIGFNQGSEFRWNPVEKTINYVPLDEHLIEHLLHEIAHAELGHTSFERDIELIALERDAWYHAKSVLAPRFNTVIDSEIIEDDLTTYRDWLQARSTCPKCAATGIQTGPATYTCVACRAVWKVNRAIGCGLKRTIQKHP